MTTLLPFRPRRREILATAVLAVAVPLVVAAISLSRQIDARLAAGAGPDEVQVFSAPLVVEPGDAVSLATLANHLQQAGYAERGGTAGSYKLSEHSIEIHPGSASFFQKVAVRMEARNGRIERITILPGGEAIPEYALEPLPLLQVEGGEKKKRRHVRHAEIPAHLKKALLAVEDKRFFDHAGVDPLRVVKAAFVNVKNGRKEQGGSTLTMQLARNLFLNPGKTWNRKIRESLIASMLEWKLSKDEILESYVNHVYLGRRDSQALHGFGQAADTYFGKALKDITLDEAALLAGLVQRPSYFDPVRHADRAMARRNLVLQLMSQNGLITEQERAKGRSAPLTLAPRTQQGSELQWFVDLALEEAHSRASVGGGKLYTTLDPGLQQAATEAVRYALPEIDKLTQSHGKRPAEVALIAIDSHTGEVKALVGGREFGRNQVNHAIAMRQPGSVFKPFVYAAALESPRGVFSPSTTLNDAPTTFRFGGQEYRPSNFGDRFYGYVPMKRALAKSMNVATVSLAERVGYEEVLRLAQASGFNASLRSTPALALGAYEATPLEVAGAYTIFANSGQHVRPTFVNEVRNGDQIVYRYKPTSTAVLDPGAAFLMQEMLSEVLQSGTAAGVRSQGFHVPAAGKTGTSRDGWFAGYVSSLICVVWVGFDDNSDLDVEGARSALPIWTAFMKKASERSAYRQELGEAPESVVAVAMDSESGLRAGPECRVVRREYFMKGKEPQKLCRHEAVPDEMEIEILRSAFAKESSDE